MRLEKETGLKTVVEAN